MRRIRNAYGPSAIHRGPFSQSGATLGPILGSPFFALRMAIRNWMIVTFSQRITIFGAWLLQSRPAADGRIVTISQWITISTRGVSAMRLGYPQYIVARFLNLTPLWGRFWGVRFCVAYGHPQHFVVKISQRNTINQRRIRDFIVTFVTYISFYSSRPPYVVFH